jgi:hypothetical protein
MLRQVFISAWGLAVLLATVQLPGQESPPQPPFYIWSTAHRIPRDTVSEESGYFSLIEGNNHRLYVGTAKYGANAYLVEFNPATDDMQIVVDAQREIGTNATGFAAQAKIHTRNNIGQSGKIYFGTKQGYPKEGESREDYPGGYPMVYDPASGVTRVYDIPVAKQGIISVTPDESRNIAYISTCDDARPIESTHFLILDLESGAYRDLLDCQHMYAFIVVDDLGRAYHPMLGGQIARYDPRTDQLQQLNQTIDDQPPTEASLLAHPQSHPINWDISPDRKTMYAVAMSGNQLYAYDLTTTDDVLRGRSLGKLIADATQTDCRAMCVGPDGTVWAGVAATFASGKQFLHVVSYAPGSAAPVDHGPVAISNPDFTELVDADEKPLPYHHGVYLNDDQNLLPRYTVMSICAAQDGTIYLTTLYPFTLHSIRIPRLAGLTTVYRHNSHADVILTRLLKTDTLDGKGQRIPARLVSLFTDQIHQDDTSRALAKEQDVPVFENIPAALTLGTDKLAVDGVLLIAEHGDYPESATGQFIFPKRRMFGQVLDVFQQSGRVVPVFCDKHLADNWTDAKWMYDQAQANHIPLMAGSSLPVCWRVPAADVERNARLKEIVAVSYHRLDAYGFHALEMVQCLAERRLGGETGIKSVQCLTGPAVWEAEQQGIFDRKLLDAALSRLQQSRIPQGKTLEESVPEPVLFVIDYQDGLRANVFTLNGAVAEWTVAWRYADRDSIESTLFQTQEERPFYHFSHLLCGINKMMQTGKPTWPVERTLLTSGLLDSLLISKQRDGQRLETPHLDIHYTTDWNWQQPPPAPPGRPINEE